MRSASCIRTRAVPFSVFLSVGGIGQNSIRGKRVGGVRSRQMNLLFLQVYSRTRGPAQPGSVKTGRGLSVRVSACLSLYNKPQCLKTRKKSNIGFAKATGTTTDKRSPSLTYHLIHDCNFPSPTCNSNTGKAMLGVKHLKYTQTTEYYHHSLSTAAAQFGSSWVRGRDSPSSPV